MGSERQATEIREDQNAVLSFQGDGAHRRPGRPDSPATAQSGIQSSVSRPSPSAMRLAYA